MTKTMEITEVSASKNRITRKEFFHLYKELKKAPDIPLLKRALNMTFFKKWIKLQYYYRVIEGNW